MTEQQAREAVTAALPSTARANPRQFSRAVAALAAGDHGTARDALRRLGASGHAINVALFADRGEVGRRLCALAVDVHFFKPTDPAAVAQLRAAGLAVDPDGCIRPLTSKGK